jgi:hypothetical protein
MRKCKPAQPRPCSIIASCLNEKRLDEFVALFTDDVEFEEGGVARGKPHVRNKVRKLLAVFRRLSHHLSNLRVTRTGPETAKSSAHIYALRHLNDCRVMEICGRYVDEQRFQGGDWKIAKRTELMLGLLHWPSSAVTRRLIRSRCVSPRAGVGRQRDLNAALAAACPSGIDADFQNIAGPAFDTVDGAHQSGRAHSPVWDDLRLPNPKVYGPPTWCACC